MTAEQVMYVKEDLIIPQVSNHEKYKIQVYCIPLLRAIKYGVWLNSMI